MSSFADRPPPEPERFLIALDAWRAGDDSAGTTMQSLKRGGLDELLAENAETAPQILAAWVRWEKGGVRPADTLEELERLGLRDVLERVAQAQREIFGGT
jgi:hypothetical protein